MEMLYARDPPPTEEPACFAAGFACNSDGGQLAAGCEDAVAEEASSRPAGESARGTEWERFKRSLSASGYFRGEMQVFTSLLCSPYCEAPADMINM